MLTGKINVPVEMLNEFPLCCHTLLWSFLHCTNISLKSFGGHTVHVFWKMTIPRAKQVSKILPLKHFFRCGTKKNHMEPHQSSKHGVSTFQCFPAQGILSWTSLELWIGLLSSKILIPCIPVFGLALLQ